LILSVDREMIPTDRHQTEKRFDTMAHVSSLKEKPTHPYFFDFKPGFLLGWFLYRLFRRVRFDENRTQDLKQMNRDGTVVYAIKYRGHLDYLLYHFRFRRSRLPYPKIAFDLNMTWFLPLHQLFRITKFHLSNLLRQGRFPKPYENGLFKGLIEQGTTSLLCLVDPKGFSRHFVHAEKDHVSFLLETQKTMDRPVYIVPQLILYKQTPERENASLIDIFFGFKDHPGALRKIFLFFRYNRRAFIDFGRPLDLKAYLESQPESRSVAEMSSEIKQLLVESIDAQKRVILGPIMKSRQQIKERVLKDPSVVEVIEKSAEGNKKQSKRLRKHAGGYFDEIAADYNSTYIELFNVALNWFWNRLFEGIDVSEPELARVRDSARKGNIIYVPSHKSHIDYLVLNYVLYQHHMHIPRTAAGKNLSFWPVGHIFRNCGAFFIRRTFKGAKLYARVFSRYVKALLEEGHPLEFFIEGGRSRSGKLILPKIGFLSILLQAQQEGYCKDLVFVPASISYDRILEEKSFLSELGGGKKESENFNQVLKARRFLKRKYGKIYIRFGRPLSLLEYLGDHETAEDTHRSVAFHLIRCINSVTLVTPLSLVATAILTKHRRGFHLSELVETGKILLNCLDRKNAQVANTLLEPAQAIQETLSLLVEWKMVGLLEDENDKEGSFYYVEEENKKHMEYYKNNIIHFLLPEAFVAVALLSGSQETRSDESVLPDYLFLTKLFKNEFIYDSEWGEQEQVAAVTAHFLESGYLGWNGTPDGYKLTKLGFDTLPMWAALAKTFLESYWIASRSLLQQEGKGRKEGDLLKNMSYLGIRYHKLGLIDHVEAISQLNFKNALRSFSGATLQQLDETGGEEDTQSLARVSQRLYELSHFRS
jgi:glycerol-3-phosphate O-acyltransferase